MEIRAIPPIIPDLPHGAALALRKARNRLSFSTYLIENCSSSRWITNMGAPAMSDHEPAVERMACRRRRKCRNEADI